jgi:hypothetical protein
LIVTVIAVDALPLGSPVPSSTVSDTG